MNFDFVGKCKYFFIISLVLVVLCLGAILIRGVALDIQFRGGSIVTYTHTGTVDIVQVEKAVTEITGHQSVVRIGSDAVTGGANFTVSLAGAQGISPETQLEINARLAELFSGSKIETVSVSNVDAAIGRDFFRKSMVAMIFAALMIILYIGIRFRKIGGWSAGVMGVVALLHDVMVAFTVFVLFGIPLNDNFIAVVLTILGCSINDTIVIYDRIRENEKLNGRKKISLREIVNCSINQSLGRAINTTLSIVLAMVVVAIMGLIYQIDTIITFAFPMVVGMISGCYSSVCLSGPLWVMWEEWKSSRKMASK